MQADDTIDTLGLLCPLPVLKARKRLSALAPGQVLALVADDPAAQIDVPHFCNEQGHALEQVTSNGSSWTFLIRKASAG